MLEEVAEYESAKEEEEGMVCKVCEEEKEKLDKEDCAECGPGIREEEKTLVLVGMDAVALFPSLTSKRTAKIVREMITKSKIKVEGFNWHKAMVYVKLNLHLTR